MVAEGLFGVANLGLNVTPVDVHRYAEQVEKNSWIPWSLYTPDDE